MSLLKALCKLNFYKSNHIVKSVRRSAIYGKPVCLPLQLEKIQAMDKGLLITLFLRPFPPLLLFLQSQVVEQGEAWLCGLGFGASMEGGAVSLLRREGLERAAPPRRSLLIS